MTLTVETIGAEGQPLCILDDFVPRPDALRAAAEEAAFELARNHYPGVRAALPAAYLESRSEEHTSELQSLMRISYAVFCLKKNKTIPHISNVHPEHTLCNPLLTTSTQERQIYYTAMTQYS